MNTTVKPAAPEYTPGQLDDSLAVPLYHQIFLILREQIRTGVFKTGDVIPGEQELSKLLNVSRITVKRAMNELAATGLVTRHRGRGTVVSYNAAVPVVHGNFDTLLDALKRLGIETDIKQVEVQEGLASEDVATALEIPPGSKVQQSLRVRQLADTAFSYHLSYVPDTIAPSFTVEDLKQNSVMELLEKSGVRLTEANQYISAVGAESEIAKALDVASGTPLLSVTRILRDSERKAVQYMVAYYRPDRFSYHIRMLRRGAGEDTRWDATEFE